MLRYDLVTGQTLFNVKYSHGVDQPAVCGDVVYIPTGSAAKNRIWHETSADTGQELSATLSGGYAPHNTICHNGHVYMGGEEDPGVNTASPYFHATGFAQAAMGPGPTHGVRPFTVNANDTRAWVTWSNYRGFSVLDTQNGMNVSNTSFGPVPTGTKVDAWSHGISLSPDGSEVYVLDRASQSVRVYTSADTPALLATVKLAHPMKGKELECSNGCQVEGWVLHSFDGRYVWVGDSGDIIDTQSRAVTGYLSELRNSKHGMLEVDWANGVPVATTTHFGVGH
jgi:DNA-binding beta-propeller fold protein YncE